MKDLLICRREPLNTKSYAEFDFIPSIRLELDEDEYGSVCVEFLDEDDDMLFGICLSYDLKDEDLMERLNMEGVNHPILSRMLDNIVKDFNDAIAFCKPEQSVIIFDCDDYIQKWNGQLEAIIASYKSKFVR